jgi:hypothetical protein
VLRERFHALRTTRIIGWTAAALTWAAAVTVRLAGVPSTAPEDAGLSQEPAGIVPATATVTTEVLPTLPEEGLVLIRSTPSPRSEPRAITRIVVHDVARPAPPVTQTAPPKGGDNGGDTTKPKKKTPSGGS